MIKKLMFVFVIFLTASMSSTTYAQSLNVPKFKLEDLPEITLPDRPQYVPGEGGERQYWLNKKDPAPYAGILLNPEAMALILSEYEAVQERARISLVAQRKNDLAVFNLEVGKLHIELEAEKETFQTKIEARQAEIDRLLKVNEDLGKAVKDRKKKFFIGIGSGSAGALIGLLLGLFVL